MEMIERLEEEGSLTVIRPVHPIEVDRMEKDTDKLRALYQEGYELAESFLASL
jgi:predicted patatin/cPLA2 family phospholipase